MKCPWKGKGWGPPSEPRACCCSLNATLRTQPQHVVACGGLQPFRNPWLHVVYYPHGEGVRSAVLESISRQPLSSHVNMRNVVSPYCTSFTTLTLESIQQKPICSKAFPSSVGARTLIDCQWAAGLAAGPSCEHTQRPSFWSCSRLGVGQEAMLATVSLLHRKILLSSAMCCAGFPRPGWEEMVLQEHRKGRFSNFKQHK